MPALACRQRQLAGDRRPENRGPSGTILESFLRALHTGHLFKAGIAREVAVGGWRWCRLLQRREDARDPAMM
jgi:hypothetical protein